jgi:hypothetical protein
VTLAIEAARELGEWLRVPETLGGHRAGWAERPHAQLRSILDRAKNPALAEWRLSPLIARRDGRAVGRLLAAQPLGAADAHFGFCAIAEQDDAALAALLDAAGAFAQAGSAARLLGPLNFSLNHTAGALVAGFEPPFAIETPQNPSWLAPMLERAGCVPLRDLLGYRLDPASLPPAAPPEGIAIERIGFATLPRGFEAIRRFYNAAWAENWGFSAVSAAEGAVIARLMRPLFWAGRGFMARANDEVLGAVVLLPDVNAVTDPLDGRLPPRAWPALAAALAGRVASARIPLLGLAAPWRGTPRGRAVMAALLGAAGATARARRWRSVEVSWVLEDNAPMRGLMRSLGAREHRRWRLFARAA